MTSKITLRTRIIDNYQSAGTSIFYYSLDNIKIYLTYENIICYCEQFREFEIMFANNNEIFTYAQVLNIIF